MSFNPKGTDNPSFVKKKVQYHQEQLRHSRKPWVIDHHKKHLDFWLGHHKKFEAMKFIGAPTDV